MMNKTKNFKITIFGEQYTLISDESDEHISKSASIVDTLMMEIASASKLSDVKRIAVLAALRLASMHVKDDFQKTEDSLVKEKLIGRIEKELNSL